MKPQERKEIFRKFIEENEILIIDKNASSRNRLMKIFFDLGAKRQMIHTASHLDEAIELFESKNIGIILSEYLISGGSGFDLFKKIRRERPEEKFPCLILVTSNMSQTVVAKAAEEDVDSFIIKPYTIQSVHENLLATITFKVNPPDYIKKIEEGKTVLKSADFDKAISIFKEACTLNEKPSLAMFYLGQANYLKKVYQGAEVSYEAGLNFNEIHFKCLMGLYDLYREENKTEEAYRVVKKIIEYFPTNTERFEQIIRLAILTRNFEDFDKFYDVYKELDERDAELTKRLGAGLFIAGKYYISMGHFDRAMNFFDKVAVSCFEFPQFLRSIITILIDHDKVDEAHRFLRRFPSGSMDTEDFRISSFLISSRQMTDKDQIIKLGLDIYNLGFEDKRLYTTLVELMKEKEYSPSTIEEIEEKLKKLDS
ncbi:MAG TPA: response regulator [Bacteriovoracaceae bacterium]|nr:response regulator [Bacteriovoracaceae bacterium]